MILRPATLQLARCVDLSSLSKVQAPTRGKREAKPGEGVKENVGISAGPSDPVQSKLLRLIMMILVRPPNIEFHARVEFPIKVAAQFPVIVVLLRVAAAKCLVASSYADIVPADLRCTEALRSFEYILIMSLAGGGGELTTRTGIPLLA